MCGICGVVYRDASEKAPPGLLARMAETMRHRGPDDGAVFEADGAGLGHRRLSIIDLSPAGRQPMSNEDGTLRLVQNGEIYNYRDLRRDLVKRGHRFTSRTDTEVILHLYEEKGERCLADLRGMFAFALWDSTRRRLFLARDRAGQKPLLWAQRGGLFCFASELKALLEIPGLGGDVDPLSIHHYLTYQYIPSPRTVFKGIQKLPAAHSLVWENGTVTVERYWDLRYTPKIRLGSMEAYRERFLEIFRDSVKMRLVSDVPLGAFLSGGIDSSAVVAAMSREGSAPVKTFSVGFSERDYNEAPFARLVAERYGTEHREMIVEPKALEVLPDLVRAFNEPFADSSALPTWHVARMTKRFVTVALSGDGGDESFAGYRRYAWDRYLSWYLTLPRFLRERVRSIAGGLIGTKRPRGFFSQVRRFLTSVDPVRERQYARYLGFFTEEQKRAVYTSSFGSSVEKEDSVALVEDLYRLADGENFLDRTLFVDTHSFLPDDILVKVDIASMAHSLETRSPFLDHRLMEFAAACPASLKLRGWQGKYLLKESLKDELPPAVIRRRKMGFGMPVAEWFRGDLKEMAYDLLLDRRAAARGYFSTEGVRTMLDEHTGGRNDHGYRLWALLFLELWFREYVDCRSVESS